MVGELHTRRGCDGEAAIGRLRTFQRTDDVDKGCVYVYANFAAGLGAAEEYAGGGMLLLKCLRLWL
jgi:hypothetical protein